jgi:hypothetical protein
MSSASVGPGWWGDRGRPGRSEHSIDGVVRASRISLSKRHPRCRRHCKPHDPVFRFGLGLEQKALGRVSHDEMSA